MNLSNRLKRHNHKVKLSTLYSEYCNWCKEKGIKKVKFENFTILEYHKIKMK